MTGSLLHTGSPRLASFIGRVDGLLGLIAALFLVGMMLLTCFDVVGRYIFDKPIPGAFEITELGMGALIFTSLPLVSLRREHVTVDMLEHLVPDFMRIAYQVVIDLVSAACVGIIGWRVWIKAHEMHAAGETTATLQIVVYPLVYYMSILTFITTALMLLLAWNDAFGARRASRTNP